MTHTSKNSLKPKVLTYYTLIIVRQFDTQRKGVIFDLKEQKGVPLTIRIRPDTFNQIKKLALSNDLNVSEQVREFIEKGLNIDGHKQDVDFIASIIRQELTAIYHIDDIKKVVEAQTNRLAKMLMKSGKLSSAEFFLMMKVLMYMWDEKAEYDFDQMLTEAVTLGVDYMQKKDFQINSFLEDTSNLRNLATGLGGE